MKLLTSHPPASKPAATASAAAVTARLARDLKGVGAVAAVVRPRERRRVAGCNKRLLLSLRAGQCMLRRRDCKRPRHATQSPLSASDREESIVFHRGV